jgi:hypothetical protein
MTCCCHRSSPYLRAVRADPAAGGPGLQVILCQRVYAPDLQFKACQSGNLFIRRSRQLLEPSLATRESVAIQQRLAPGQRQRAGAVDDLSAAGHTQCFFDGDELHLQQLGGLAVGFSQFPDQLQSGQATPVAK